jgi:hypothetical protein
MEIDRLHKVDQRWQYKTNISKKGKTSLRTRAQPFRYAHPERSNIAAQWSASKYASDCPNGSMKDKRNTENSISVAKMAILERPG